MTFSDFIKGQLGLVNMNVEANVPIDASQNFTSTTYSPQTTTNNQSTFTDARTLQLTINSPNAITKKQDSISAAPILTGSPVSAPSTSQQGGNPGISPALSLGSVGGSSLLMFAAIGAIVIGGVVLISKSGKK